MRRGGLAGQLCSIEILVWLQRRYGRYRDDTWAGNVHINEQITPGGAAAAHLPHTHSTHPAYPRWGPPPAPSNTHKPQILRYQCLFRVAAQIHQGMRKLHSALVFRHLTSFLDPNFPLSSVVHCTWMKSSSRLAEELEVIGGLASAAPIVLEAPCFAAKPTGRTDTHRQSRAEPVLGGLRRDVDAEEIFTSFDGFSDLDDVGRGLEVSILSTGYSGRDLGVGYVRGRSDVLGGGRA